MKILIKLSIFLSTWNIIYCQHNDIIFDVPTDMTIQFNEGDYYWIDWHTFEVNGTKYDYGDWGLPSSMAIYPNHFATIVILEGGGEIFPLQSLYGRFKGKSGMYRIIFNIDVGLPNVQASAKLTLVNKQTHLNRNKYNKVAKGVLIRKSRNIFVDENGCEWELQDQCFNAFHEPSKNAKFLHKVADGGEYETIREIKSTEGRIVTSICPHSDIIPIKKMKFITVEVDTLRGSNVLSGKYQSSYNFGHTGFSSFFKHKHLDMSPHEETFWGGNYLSTAFNSHINGCNKKISSTLFLFDLSGSMSNRGANSNKSKLQQAKDASKTTLNSLSNSTSGSKPEVGILGFSGGCPGPNGDPTTGDPNWDTDFQSVQNRIDGLFAGGGTPLYEAIEAAQCKLAKRLQENNQKSGKLIVLSDGAATCKKIRPQGVYNSSKVHQWKIDVDANKCGVAATPKIKYYTIGFNINPGSPAERDLQFLAQSTGGKYLNVQSQTQLERAFRKFNRTYIPKPTPALSNLPTSSESQFDKGVSQINSESFTSALDTYEAFAGQHADDCHGAYNLALMQEANDFYKKAIANYQKYLSLCPSAPDKEFVEKQIVFLEEEFRQFLIFQKKVIQSDLEYLKLHFEKIQNGQSVALAEEFKGFLKEKGDYYINLPELMGRTDRLFKKNTKEVAEGLDNCAKTINRNPETWDRDATPALSMTFLNLERLLNSL